MRLLDANFMKSLAEPSYAPTNLLLLRGGAPKQVIVKVTGSAPR